MNSYYTLILTNFIGVLLFSNNFAMANAGLHIVLNIPDRDNITDTSTCGTIQPKYLSSVNEENDSKAKNADLPQASIWWAAEQFDPFDGSLIQNWLTYPQKQQINLTVDWQLWTTLDYFGRYRFVNQFGTVVRKHGYSLNVFSQKEQCLATYKYNSASKPPKWELRLEKLGRDSLESESSKKI